MAQQTNGNDPAFSRPASYGLDGSADNPQEGLNKREYFAAMAMQGMLSANSHGLSSGIVDVKGFVEISVYAADALIEQLNKQLLSGDNEK